MKLLKELSKDQLYHKTRSPKFIIDTTIELNGDNEWFTREDDYFLIWDGSENQFNVKWYIK